MLVTKKIEIDMGHRVPNHKSKCRNLHGHRYIFEVGVDDKVIKKKGSSDEGMVIDFSDLKKIMMKVIDEEYDHGFMMYEKDIYVPIFELLKNGQALDLDEKWSIGSDDYIQKIIFVPFVPTAENIAKEVFLNMKLELLKKGIAIKHVRLWETPTSTAVYTDEDWLLDKKTNNFYHAQTKLTLEEIN